MRTHWIIRALMALLAALIVGGVAPGEAGAQTGREQAQVIFKEGQALFLDGRHAEAAIKFLNAYQLDPHPAIMYNVGRAYEETGRLIKALQYYRVALGLKPSKAVRDELNRKIQEVELFLRSDGVDVLSLESADWVPKGKVSIETEPPGADVTINGNDAGRTPVFDKILPQGDYIIIVRKQGFRAEERSVTVVGGKSYLFKPRLRIGDETDPALRVQPGILVVTSNQRDLTIFLDGEPVGTTPIGQIELSPGEHNVTVEGEGFPTYEETVVAVSGETVRVTARRPQIIRAEPQEETFLSQSEWGWVVAGTGGGALLVGGLLGTLALVDASAYNNERGAPERAERRSDAQTEGLIADVSFIAGAGLIVVGALMITFDEEAPVEETAPVYLDELVWKIGPQLLPDGAGVQAVATW